MAETVTRGGLGSPRPAAREGALARLGLVLADWSEQWFPDAFVFALCAVIVVALGALALGAPPEAVATRFGNGFWDLIPFTMQMALIIIGGYVVASSPPVWRLIERLAQCLAADGRLSHTLRCSVCSRRSSAGGSA